MYCQKCGNDIGDKKICGKCGWKEENVVVAKTANKSVILKKFFPFYDNPYEFLKNFSMKFGRPIIIGVAIAAIINIIIAIATFAISNILLSIITVLIVYMLFACAYALGKMEDFTMVQKETIEVPVIEKVVDEEAIANVRREADAKEAELNKKIEDLEKQLEDVKKDTVKVEEKESNVEKKDTSKKAEAKSPKKSNKEEPKKKVATNNKESDSKTDEKPEFIFCPECGSKLPGVAEFCEQCGSKIEL